MRAVLALALVAVAAAGDEPSVAAIVSTIRFHPEGEPARLGFSVLSRRGAAGWRALGSLVAEYASELPDVAREAARAYAEGPEPERLELVAGTYLRVEDEEIRAILAAGLAYGYAEHEELLLRHLREGRRGAAEVCAILVPQFNSRELREFLAVPELAPVVYPELRKRALPIRARELLPWARVIARAALDPPACEAWAARRDFLIYEAVALAVGDGDEDVRDGAQCLLLTLSGKKLLADVDVWRSWVAAQREKYEAPPPRSPGRVAAAVVRAARFLRRDLLDDGRCVWSAEPNGGSAVGATALAVLALRAAGYAANHPAIEKAVRETLILLGPRGAPSLRELEDRSRETYVLALLAMALCELDAERYRVPLEALRKRLLTGMQPHGQWGYRCLRPTDHEQGTRPDNSITQYAVLALRSLAKAGFEIGEETWRTIAENFVRTQTPEGRWYYHPAHGGPAVSMTSAGISSLAICLEGLHGAEAPEWIRKNAFLRRGRTYLGRLLMTGDYGDAEPYAYYGVERAMILTATQGFRSPRRTYDWYDRGARRLLEKQAPDGHWGWWEPRLIVGQSFGPAVDTAYGILFLTRATTTIGRGEAEVVLVPLKPEEDEPEPEPPAPEPAPETPPPPPDLRVEWDRVPTRTGSGVIRGAVRPPGATLTMDRLPVPVDVRGRFAVPVEVNAPRTFELVATGADGLVSRREVALAFDTKLPSARLWGPPRRHAGKQVLIFRADEPLRFLQVAGRVYPADGPVVRAAVEVREGRRTLTVVATDRAGNTSHNEVEIEAADRALVLDGGSAVGVDLRESPERFTVECWARGEAPAGNAALVANTESAGFGLFWAAGNRPSPTPLVLAGGQYLAVAPRKAWSWNAWTHLAMTWDGRRLRYFVDGRLQGEAEGGPYRPSGHRLFIGAQPDRHDAPSEFFRGEIDEVRISRIVRYEDGFRPEESFFRDRHTVLLLHFDRDTLADGVVLDDSGLQHHGFLHGAPTLRAKSTGAPPRADVLAHARGELAVEAPAPQAAPLTPEQNERQNAAAREAAAGLCLIDVTVRLRTPGDRPLAGVEVRGLHEKLDVSSGPATTDGRGEAALRLPRGPWRLELATAEPKAGGEIVFARVRHEVPAAGAVEVVLDSERKIRLRDRLGAARVAQAVTLAWPDLTYHRRIDITQADLDVRTTGDAPILLQLERRPDEDSDGFVLRRTAGPGTTTVRTDPEERTVYTFDGKGVRRLDVRLTSADPLPVDVGLRTRGRRSVLFAGLPEIVVGLDVEWHKRTFGFYPRPFALDGTDRTFDGGAPARASVGYVHNWREQYRDRRNSVDIRVFLTTENGLLVKWDPKGAYTVAWEQLLDGQVRASGEVRPPLVQQTPIVDPGRIGDLRYRLRIRGPGGNRTVEVAGHPQTADVWGGEARTWAFPEVAPNARMWLLCVSRAIRAYEETCPANRHHTNVDLSMVMPAGLAGMGGWGGNDGWLWLPEASLYGFAGQWYWTGLLSHELGHVHGYGHGNPTQTRIMRQAGRRAGRRLWALRPDAERVPEGDRFRRLLEAVTRGEVAVEQDFDEPRELPILRRTSPDHAVGDGVLVPNLEITGDDAVFTWYWRSMFGAETEAVRRANAAVWSWWLTTKGFSDEEIQIALYSRAAGTSLAWLARMRGTVVHDHRIEAAMQGLAGAEFPPHEEYGRIRHHWLTRRYARGDDLAAEEARMRAELGERWSRFQALLGLARARFARGEPAAGEATVRRALAEARIGGEGMLENAVAEAAALWVTR